MLSEAGSHEIFPGRREAPFRAANRKSRTMVAPDLSDTIGTIYEASLEPARWYDTVARVVEFVGGERGMVALTDLTTGQDDASYFYRLDAELMRRWGEEYGFEDPWADRMVGVSEGEVGRGCDLMPYEQVRTKRVYQEIAEPVGAHDTCWAAIAKNGLRVGWLSAFQGKEKGPFPRESVEKMAFLAPHLVRSARIHTRFAELGARDRANEAALDALSFALLTCRSDGGLVTANRSAEALLRSAKTLRLASGRLACANHEQTSALRGLIAAASETALGDAAAGGGSMLVHAAAGASSPMVTMVGPISARLEGECLPQTSGTAATAMLIVSDLQRPMNLAEGVLAELYGFTPKETQVAIALARGDSTASYAAAAGLSLETARWYVKQVMAKAGTRRQGELVSLLHRTLDPTSLIGPQDARTGAKRTPGG